GPAEDVMGLDWLAGQRPQEGHEERFWALFEQLEAQEAQDDAMMAEWQALGVPAWQCVGAPVVGQDAAADAWVIDRLAQNGIFGAKAQERLRDMAGFHVLELAPPSDGMPVYTHAGMYDGVDETSFRGAFLEQCEEALAPELLAAAWKRKQPAEGLAYGEALRDAARRWAQQHGCVDVLELGDPEEMLEGPAFVAHVLDAAGRWCIHWSSRGHLLDVWF
ncbi:MAG: hypothetical protein KC656_20415, partial [Myxococcales bacterium]|nr:hypothetical protein [Myxococcales bacterium]